MLLGKNTKKIIDPYLISNKNSKWIIGLNMKDKTIKFLGKIKGLEYFNEPEASKFLEHDIKQH